MIIIVALSFFRNNTGHNSGDIASPVSNGLSRVDKTKQQIERINAINQDDSADSNINISNGNVEKTYTDEQDNLKRIYEQFEKNSVVKNSIIIGETTKDEKIFISQIVDAARIQLLNTDILPIVDTSTKPAFDDLHINTLFVDEAHNFKNITIDTKTDNVLGINANGSMKYNEMLNKVRYTQQTNNGRGVIFATGTPISNSVTDIFVMQTYLQYEELKALNLSNFDSWILTFGEKVANFEVDVDTNAYRLATRFTRFHNLPELTSLLAQIANFHKVYRTNELPGFDEYSDMLIPKTAQLAEYLKEISERAEKIRTGLVRKTDDNMLKLTTDGRKAALDIRLAVLNALT